MEPVVQAAVAATDPTITAALLALAVAMMEIIRQLITWVLRKMSGKDHKQTLTVQLDHEVSNIMHDTGNKVQSINAIVSRVDVDGVPLVYADRKTERTIDKVAETLERISNTQDRIQDGLNKLEQRFEAHDKTDAITFVRLADSQERLEDIADANRSALQEIKMKISH